MSAIRAGNWKLLEYFEDSRLELYDLSSDLSEEHNLADSDADVAKRLHERLRQWPWPTAHCPTKIDDSRRAFIKHSR